MPRKAVIALLLAVMLAPAAMALAGQAITISGSTTVLPLAQRTAEEYMKRYPDVRISVAGTGSGDGIRALIDGTADIGNSSRDLKDKEKKLALQKGVEVAKHVVALDCIVPVVHPSNPVSDLTTEQLGAIYAGKVRNWSQVGGEDRQVVAISRDSSSGTFEVWNHKVLGERVRVRPDAQLQASNGAVAQAVAGNKYAIGYVGLGYVHEQVKALKVNGVKPSPETARSGAYPIARGLNMFTKASPKVAVQGFIDFVLSPLGQEIVVREGFVPVR
ncbi:phosphate ABC transporter substrate-binding protein [Desulfocarbo indianensis]|nr:phosphate ABC transporter substrate-binding protein [Desulfocarbo indianensis]